MKEGAGISFCYYAPIASLAAVPIGSVDSPFIFEEVTADFQSVTIQGQITFRIVDPKKIAELLNYSLDSRGKAYVSDDPQKLIQKVINSVRVLTKKYIENSPLKDAIKSSEKMARYLVMA